MMLVTTSGTTGRPKSFLLTHANVLHNVRALACQGIVTQHDRALLPLPLHHVYPLTVGILTPFALGTTVVLPESVTGPHIVAALKEARCTVMVAVPRLYAALLNGLLARVAQLPGRSGRCSARCSASRWSCAGASACASGGGCSARSTAASRPICG